MGVLQLSFSKAAINHMIRNLAFDYGTDKIRIDAIGTEAVRTHAFSKVLTPEIEKKMLAHTPIKRLGEPEDIAGAVLYFCSSYFELDQRAGLIC